ncbi:MAG: hypothetical protein AB8B72_09290 [Crocinitomicaceae bacterium]
MNSALKNPTIQQYGLEFLFPIVGYLLFDWSFLLIVLFYLVDQLGNQINFFARLKFVEKLFRPKKKWLFPLAIGIFIVLFSAEIALISHFFLRYIYDCQTSYFYEEINSFLIGEFWLFLPLLILINYFKDKMTFYKTELPYQESPDKMLIINLLSIFSVFVLVALVFIGWMFLKPAIVIIVILIAVLKLLNDAFILPQFKVRYFKKI